MPEFLFPGGVVWMLRDPEELGVARLENGGLALLLFTDEDLATTYASGPQLSGKTAQFIVGNLSLLNVLLDVKPLGVTHVAIDHTPGKTANTMTIDKAIKYASGQID